LNDLRKECKPEVMSAKQHPLLIGETLDNQVKAYIRDCGGPITSLIAIHHMCNKAWHFITSLKYQRSANFEGKNSEKCV